MKPIVASGVLMLALLTAVAPAAEKGRKLAVVVGVNECDAFPALKYAAEDARVLAEVLRSPACGFEDVAVLTTTGKTTPTAANVRAALTKLLKGATKADTVLIALAGHGVQVEVKDPAGGGEPKTYPFFCPAESDLTTVKYATGHSDTLINLDDLLGALAKSEVGTRLVLLDAGPYEPKRPPGVRGLAAGRLTVPGGVRVMLSCGRGQSAYEADDLKHGLFFHHVIEGLKGEARNDRGEVTWADLGTYTKREVEAGAKRRFKKAQTPAALGAEGAVVLSPARPLRPAKAGAEPPDTTWVVEGAEVVAVLNARRLFGSKLMKGGLTDRLDELMRSHDVVKLSLERLGMDLTKDVDRIVFSGVNTGEKKLQYAVKGRIDRKKVLQAWKASGRAKVSKEGDVEVVQLDAPGVPTLYAAFTAKDSLVVTESKERTVKLARDGPPRSVKLHRDVVAALASFSGEEALTAVTLITAELKKAASAEKAAAAVVKPLTAMTLSVKVTDAVEVEAFVGTADEAGAGLVEKHLIAYRAAVELAAGTKGIPPLAVDLVGAVKIEKGRNGVTATLSITKEQVEKAVKLIPGGK